MKISQIKVERLYNLGNYENIKYELIAEIEETDTLEEAFKILEDILDKQAEIYKEKINQKKFT